MRVDVRAAGDQLHCFADRTAIFQHGLVFRQIAQSDLVAKGYIVKELYFSDLFAFKSQGSDRASFFEINDRNPYIVLRLVQQDSMFHNQTERIFDSQIMTKQGLTG